MPETKTESTASAGRNGRASSLFTKLSVAQTALEGGVGKHGRNEQHKYDYTTAEDVIRAANKAVRDAGLVAHNTVFTDSITLEKGATKSGTAQMIAHVKGQLTLTDPDTGEEVRSAWSGVGMDVPGDKAVYKAISGGQKYGWQMLLQIAFGDDPENDQAPGASSEFTNLPEWAGPASDELKQTAARALEWLVGPNARVTWEGITSRLGVEAMPRGVAWALLLAIKTRKEMDEPTESEPPAKTEANEPEAEAAATPEGDFPA